MGLLAVGSTAAKTVPLHNSSKSTITWKLAAPDDFAIQPAFGILNPGDTQALEVAFTPRQADQYDTAAAIKYDADDGEHCGVTDLWLRGVAKYPHVSFKSGAREKVVDFGQLRQGEVLEKRVVLQNHSPVDAPYSIRHSYLGDSCIRLNGNTGVVPANSTATITVAYTAGRPYHHCNEYLTFRFHAGIQLRLACKGDT